MNTSSLIKGGLIVAATITAGNLVAMGIGGTFAKIPISKMKISPMNFYYIDNQNRYESSLAILEKLPKVSIAKKAILYHDSPFLLANSKLMRNSLGYVSDENITEPLMEGQKEIEIPSLEYYYGELSIANYRRKLAARAMCLKGFTSFPKYIKENEPELFEKYTNNGFQFKVLQILDEGKIKLMIPIDTENVLDISSFEKPQYKTKFEKAFFHKK